MTEESMPSYRLFLLGCFRLEADGALLSLRTRKTEILLAYLALHPLPQAREYLAGLLWGSGSDDAARASLRQELSALRKVLGDQALLADRQVVQLNPEFSLWVDVCAFRQIVSTPGASPEDVQAATALYQGDLLPESYDDWVLSEREALHKQHLEALLRLVQYYRSQSEYEKAIRLAQQALTVEPGDERAHQHLMVCYASSGDRAAALHQYEQCRNSLRSLLNVEPSPETETLYRRIQKTHAFEQSAASARLTNLPISPTSFVGRATALEEVEGLLQPLARGAVGVRLLTLVGMGGSGKTRLALQAAHELVDVYADGVWWIELAALNDSALLPQVAAAALGVKPKPGESPEAVLLEYLRQRQVLLVLDNCEHLLAACAQFVDHLMCTCPDVQIMATSREPLRVAGEQVWVTPPLEIPASSMEATHDLVALLAVESVRLFVERANEVRRDFRLTPVDAPAVIEICRRLDGLPLAIELAAARVRTLTCDQINRRLDDRFRLLASGSRTALPRQQTLRALIDWSHNLLSPAEQILFRRLAVFAGGWTLEAAEAVCAGQVVLNGDHLESLDVLDLLSALVDKSLVITQEKGRVMRFSFLETLREYALDRLQEAGEQQWARARHLDCYLALAEIGGPALLESQDPSSWLERLGADHENLRQALAWALGNDPPRSLQLAGALWPFWEMGAPLVDEHSWLHQPLDDNAQRDEIVQRARSLIWVGTMAWRRRDWRRAEALHRRALELYRQVGETRGAASALINLATQWYAQGEYERAEALYQDGLDMARQTGDALLISAALNNLGIVTMELRRYEMALQFLQEALNLARQENNQSKVAIALHNLAEVTRIKGDSAQALEWYTQSLAESERADYKLGVAMNTWGQGAMRFVQGDYLAAETLLQDGLRLAHALSAQDWVQRGLVWLGLAVARRLPGLQAVKLLAAAQALSQEVDYLDICGIDAQVYAQTLSDLRKHLGEDTFQSAWFQGAALSLEQAVALALQCAAP